MSPYETRYVDVRIDGDISGPVTVALEEGLFLPSYEGMKLSYCSLLYFFKKELFELVYIYYTIFFADSQQWRLVCLAIGLILLLLAPILSNWVPFYYSSSMAIGIFLVIIILLFQVCKLLSSKKLDFIPFKCSLIV